MATAFSCFGVSGYASQRMIWVRMGQYGFVFSRTPKTFSERNGYRASWQLPGGWRLQVLSRVQQ